jgi:serine/threonine-protein kinase
MNEGIDRKTWLDLSRLLDEALDLPADQRAQWLNSLDPVHDALKQKLQRLLSRAEEAGTEDFLRRLPPVEGAPNALETQNTRVGPYRLVREIGSGGMASVWLAERDDGLINRPVALKLPHRAWRHAQLADRMAREREILAALNHPNIATLYDAGISDDGQPYLALEYVRGEPIDAYCRTLALPLRYRLGLFIQVTRAVAHAHTKLIVHRDLKPSNILVTPEGEVRLLDFGIAKLLEDPTPGSGILTEQSGRAMTPDYAAPEQILGDPLTVAADIYSLGVVLFEILTGTRPYRLERDSRGALEDAILGAQPRKPSEVAPAGERRALRGDLDTIVLKALKKLPQERYATADALADDIERYLRHKPVLARPDSWRYAARKFVVRHRVAVAAATTVFLAVLAGGATALWEARQANAEKERAEEARKFLTSVLQNANPYAAAAQPRTVEEWLVQESAAADERTDLRPELRIEALTILGTSLLNAQNTAAAERVLSRAVARSRTELGADHALTIHARVAFATLLRFRGRAQLLRAELDDLLPRLRAQPGPYPEDLPVSLRNKTHLEVDDGHYAQAETDAREELEVATRVMGRDHPEAVTALMMLAYAVQQSRDPAYALRINEESYRTTIARYKNQPRFPRIIEAERLYGRALANADQLPEALHHIRIAVSNASAVFGNESRMTGLSTVDLARAELKHGEIAEAVAHSSSAVDIVAKHADRNSSRFGDALAVRGMALLAAGRTQEAVNDLQTAREILDGTLGPAHPIAISVAETLARARLQLVAAHRN